MSHLLYEINVEQGQKIRVDQSGQASVRLLDLENLRRFQAGAEYSYYGGHASGPGFELTPPGQGLWYLVVDRGWLPTAANEVAVSVLPAPTNPWLVAGVVLAFIALLVSLTAEETPKRQRAARPKNIEPLDRAKRFRVYERDGGVCTYCGVPVALDEFHVDHSVSRNNGGTNHMNNLRTACAPCNLSKGSLNGRQFRGRGTWTN